MNHTEDAELTAHEHEAMMRVYQHALRTDFLSFMRKAFDTLHPNTDFVPNWHLELLSHYLHAIEQGDCQRLIVNMPPRSLKSLTISVAWSSFVLGRNPAAKIITSSYSSALSIKHAMDVRALVECGWYRQIFPQFDIRAGQNEKHKFSTTQHGFRLASSVGGTITGEGSDIIIIDDPLNPAQAMSSSFRARANDWFDHTLSSRLNDKRHGAMVLVMQRLHEDDLTGHLMRKGGWDHVSLPAQAPDATLFSYGRFVHQMRAGELLQPVREPATVLADMARDLGSAAFAAQYLQSPISLDGGLFLRAWLRDDGPPEGEVQMRIHSWDTAIKTGQQHDVSVCVTLHCYAQGIYIANVLCARADFPALKKLVISHYDAEQPDALLIEDKASGQSLLQELQHTSLPAIAIMPKGDKIMRAARITPLLEAGNVSMPQHSAWKDAFITELLSFPNGAHDDQVDALTQGLSWVQQRHSRGATYVRSL